MTVSSVNQSDWIAGERIRRGEIVYWEPSDDLVWRLDVESAKSKQDRIIGIATNDVREGDVVDVAMTSSPPQRRLMHSSGRPFVTPYEYAETFTHYGEAMLHCTCGLSAVGLEIDYGLCLSCGTAWGVLPNGRWAKLKQMEEVVCVQNGSISEEAKTKLERFFEDGGSERLRLRTIEADRPTGFKSGDSIDVSIDGAPAETVTFDAEDGMKEAANRLIATGPTIKSRIITDHEQWVDAFGPKPSKPKHPPSRHQTRQEKRYAMRPLPGDDPAKQEGSGRRWFWLAVLALMTLLSGAAAVLTIADRWPV
jgi:hypothetical protein